MIIKRNKNDRLSQLAKPKRAQVVEVARAVKNERRKFLSEFAVEFLD